jgi:SAM-dependent methyltransferase
MIMTSEALVRFSHRFDPRWKFFHRIKNTERILELGCGAGDSFRRLRSLSSTAELHGIDIMEPDQIEETMVYHKLDLNRDRLPYDDNFFDAILFTHVIEHLQSPWQLSGEIQRVLKPGGVIYVETPNWTSMLVPSFGIEREQHNPFNFFDDPTHIRPWTKHSLYEFVSGACGLNVEKVSTVRNWPRIPFDVLKMLYGIISGNRRKVVSAFWNIYGWCIYSIGVKRK